MEGRRLLERRPPTVSSHTQKEHSVAQNALVALDQAKRETRRVGRSPRRSAIVGTEVDSAPVASSHCTHP